MKTKEYVNKYRLDQNDKFSHSEFVHDLTHDFLALLEVSKNGEGKINIKGFMNSVRAVRMKWDAINNKTLGQLPEKLWSYFYAVVVCKMRAELFPEEEKKKEERRKEWEEREKKQNSFYDDIFNFFVFNWFHLIRSVLRPVSSFEILNLSKNATVEDVKQSYRQLSLIHHPDRGGDKSRFIKITEAKNRCLEYLQSK